MPDEDDQFLGCPPSLLDRLHTVRVAESQVVQRAHQVVGTPVDELPDASDPHRPGQGERTMMAKHPTPVVAELPSHRDPLLRRRIDEKERGAFKSGLGAGADPATPVQQDAVQVGAVRREPVVSWSAFFQSAPVPPCPDPAAERRCLGKWDGTVLGRV
ncbi:hypothetical protein ACWC5I_37085 [Kitasatospora sp. NPDC001574]